MLNKTVFMQNKVCSCVRCVMKALFSSRRKEKAWINCPKKIWSNLVHHDLFTILIRYEFQWNTCRILDMLVIKRKEAHGCVKYAEIVLFLRAAEEIVNAWIKLAGSGFGLICSNWSSRTDTKPLFIERRRKWRHLAGRPPPPAMTSWVQFPVGLGSSLCRVCVPPWSGVGLMPIMMLWIRTHCIRGMKSFICSIGAGTHTLTHPLSESLIHQEKHT